MKILVANNTQPFVWGGAEDLAQSLVANLVRHGHEAEVLRIPFRYHKAEAIPLQMAAARILEMDNVDRLIALKFPAYLLRHPAKTVWLVHQFRQAYDLFDSGMSTVPSNEQGDEIRAAITAADTEAMVESRRVFAISPNAAQRLERYNGVAAEVLYHPLSDPELFTGGESEGYIFAGGRINSMKRQRMLVEALPHASSAVKLIIAGPPESDAFAAELVILAEKLGVADRVVFDFGYLPRATIAEYVNAAAACACIPFDEDSLSYVGMEAAHASRPLITARDSGGILGLVTERSTGWVCEPEPKSLAHAMSEAIRTPKLARRYGRNLAEKLRSLNITWDHIIERLTE
ncbi:MAG: glycosyltransferase [Salinibacterium sp.]|nr:MAG: glycosyltransferase [Salinibacterium sp.]